MKKMIGMFLVLILCVAVIFPGTSKAEIIAEGSFVTDYMWRGFNVLNGSPAFQPAITFKANKLGITANAWASWALTKRSDLDSTYNAEWDELDLTIDWTRSFGPVDFTIGYFHLNWFNHDKWPDELTTTSEVFTGISFTRVPFTPTVTVYYDYNKTEFKNGIPESVGGDGVYVLVELVQPVEAVEGTVFDLYFSTGYMDQEWVAKDGISDVNFGFSTAFNLNGVEFIPGFTATFIPMDDINNEHFVFWGRLGFIRSFLSKN